MSDVYEIIGGAGKGGDGLLTILKTISYAAMAKNWQVAYSSNYNPETRGGLVEGCTIFSSSEVLSPVVDRYTTVIAFDEESFDAYVPHLEPNGWLFWNSSVVKNRVVPENLKSVPLAVSEIAALKGISKVSNMLVLGAFARFTGYFTLDELVQGMEMYLPVWRHNLIPINKQILAGVFAASAEELTTPPEAFVAA
jgi:2-oxoglutarate ferredoxin oxidoreductase subunit gamma